MAINHTLERISLFTSTFGDSPISNVLVRLSSSLISSSKAKNSHSVEHGLPPKLTCDLQDSEVRLGGLESKESPFAEYPHSNSASPHANVQPSSSINSRSN